VNLVVDLGQSGARFKVGDEIRKTNIAKNSSEELVQTLSRIFKEVPAGRYENIYLSLTGLQGEVGDPRPFGELCSQSFDAKKVFVMDDGIASYLGALGKKSGVVLTLGGGVVAISCKDGAFGHADGKGPIFGDFGGGFWIGQKGLQKVIATIDGRDADFSLVDFMQIELSQHKSLINKTGVEASQLCISSAKKIVDGAQNGITSAQEILNEGAQYLAKTIFAAWQKVKGDSKIEPYLAIQGGLSRSEYYVNQITKELEKLMAFQFTVGAGDHIVGALIAAELYPSGVDPLMKVWSA
jgi:glucosamine kinase